MWNNASGPANGNVSTGAGVLNTNPLFVSTTDLRLTSNSPARFATAGSTDLGALPYDGDATPGLYGPLWVNPTLSAAQSPHTVGGDRTVPAGVPLTIEPGATLRPAGMTAGSGYDLHGRLRGFTVRLPATISQPYPSILIRP